MPPTPTRLPASRAPGSHSLRVAAAWSHRSGALAWSAFLLGFLAYFGAAYWANVSTFTGGASAFGAAAAPMAEGMRALVGPAQRLDTFGGYTTYHNTAYVVLALSLWGLIQGARAVRGWEERGVVDLWLAAGHGRVGIAVDRWLGFLAALAVIAAAYGMGLGASAAIAGAPNPGGSAVVALETALVAAAFFGLGLLLAQVTPTARGAAGWGAIAMAALFVVANLAADLGPLGWVRFLSPFWYFQQSRALVPGQGIDPAATAVLVVTALALVGLAAWAFRRRDAGAPLVRRRWEPRPRRARLPRSPWLSDAWTADVRQQALTLAAWFAATVGMLALMMSVAGRVTEVWMNSELIRRLFEAIPGRTFVDQYVSYMAIMAAIVPAAYAVAESARWVSDLGERRVELLQANGVTRSRAVLEWAAAVVPGLALLAVAVPAGCLLGGVIAGVEMRGDGLVRVAAAAMLMGLAVTGVALLAVTVVRGGAAVGVLGAFLGASFVVSLFGPMFKWPDWLLHLSLLDAFGTPYVAVPKPGGLALLAGCAILGGAAAIVVARRRPTFG